MRFLRTLAIGPFLGVSLVSTFFHSVVVVLFRWWFSPLCETFSVWCSSTCLFSFLRDWYCWVGFVGARLARAECVLCGCWWDSSSNGTRGWKDQGLQVGCLKTATKDLCSNSIGKAMKSYPLNWTLIFLYLSLLFLFDFGSDIFLMTSNFFVILCVLTTLPPTHLTEDFWGADSEAALFLRNPSFPGCNWFPQPPLPLPVPRPIGLFSAAQLKNISCRIRRYNKW